MLDTGCWMLDAGYRVQLSAQPLAGEAASLIEDETSWEAEKSFNMLWERFSLRGASPTGWRQSRLTRFSQCHDRGWKPLPPDINLSLKNDFGFHEVSNEAGGM
jgi:hypothetical protein